MKKIIIISIISIALVRPGLAKAAYTASVSQNNIKVTGDCSANVLITLAKANNPGKIVYSGGAICAEKKFYFSDNLLKWEVEDGKYNIMVNGQKSGKTVERKKMTLEIQSDDLETPPKIVNGSSEKQNSPDVIFLKALADLQKSLLDMQVAVSQTTYPQIVKNSLEATLDSLQVMAAKVVDILWSIDSPDSDSSEKEAKLAEEDKKIKEEVPSVNDDLEMTKEPQPQIQQEEFEEDKVQFLEIQPLQQAAEISPESSFSEGLSVSVDSDMEK